VTYDLNKWVANERRSLPRKRYVPFAVAAMLLVNAAMPFIEVFDRTPDSRVFSTAVPLLLLAVTMATSPFTRDAWLGLGSGSKYDEFQRAIAARATARAFAVLLGLILLVFLWFWVASLNGWPMPRTPLDWSAFALAFLAIGVALPVLFAEIMVPLPPREGEDDA
jgi:hypothetical protein